MDDDSDPFNDFDPISHLLRQMMDTGPVIREPRYILQAALPEEKPMTEQEWLTSTDPARMLDFFRGMNYFTGFQGSDNPASDRKLRLFVEHCRSVVSRQSGHDRYDHALTNDLSTERGLRAALEDWGEVLPSDPLTGEDRAALLRDIFGNPYKPVKPHYKPHPTMPAVTAIQWPWLTPTVLALASAAYETRCSSSGHLDRSTLLVLSDALEEAGADDALIAHLRCDTTHVRGCWVIDLLTGRS